MKTVSYPALCIQKKWNKEKRGDFIGNSILEFKRERQTHDLLCVCVFTSNQYLWLWSTGFQKENKREKLKAYRTHAPLVGLASQLHTHQCVAEAGPVSSHQHTPAPSCRLPELSSFSQARGHRTRHKKQSTHMRYVTSKEKCSPGFYVCVGHFRFEMHCLLVKNKRF